jgi:hypothetical protein
VLIGVGSTTEGLNRLVNNLDAASTTPFDQQADDGLERRTSPCIKTSVMPPLKAPIRKVRPRLMPSAIGGKGGIGDRHEENARGSSVQHIAGDPPGDESPMAYSSRKPDLLPN